MAKNILFHISVRDEFSTYIDPNFSWQKASVTNRGLVDDAQDAEGRKTAVQKNIALDRMLGLIAQFSPDLLNNDIVNKSTSLNWIWNRIRKHYSFSQSEVNFLKINTIKRESAERYETFYQRIVAHIEDNLLTVESGVEHDGAALTENEQMTPTVDRLIVNMWLNLIDTRLPAYISRVYAHDLQRKSLKDVQPQICEAMDELLGELNAQDNAQVNLARSSYNGSHNYGRAPAFFNNNRNQLRSNPQRQQQQHQQQRFNRGPQPQTRGPQPQPQTQMICILCKLVGRQFQGHDIRNCYHVSRAEKVALARSLDTTYDGDDGETYEPVVVDEFNQLSLECTPCSQTADYASPSSVQRVSCNPSPFFFAFYKHHTCKVLIDSGATSTLISYRFAMLAGLEIKPTLNSARQLDKSIVPVRGEVKFTIYYGSLELHVDGLVNDSLTDCDILAGVPFGKRNKVTLPLHTETIIIDGVTIPYGSKPATIQHDIYRAESVVLRNNTTKVLLPGDFVEFSSPSLSPYEGEVAIEPRVDSVMNIKVLFIYWGVIVPIPIRPSVEF